MGPSTFAPLPEPPSLGTLPKGTRGRALVLSAVIYGCLVAGATSLLLAPPTPVLARRTLAVALDEFDALPAPPPPAGASAPARASALPNPRVDTPTPSAPSEEPRPVLEPALPTPAPGPVGAPGALGGLPGGQPGGVAGGQVGGTAGGQGAGVVAPRFDAAYLQNSEPDYPSLSKRLGEEGRVILRVLVNPEGLAEQMELRQSSGHARLDQAALATVRRWRFIPARRGAERLAAWVLVPLSFSLDA